MPNLAVTRSQNVQGSPSATSPPVLPGYRDAIFGTAPQTLAWRDSPRGAEPPSAMQQQLSRMMNPVHERRSSQPGTDSPNPYGSAAMAHRTVGAGGGYTPPLLTSESTGTTRSGGSSAGLFAPRTPLEPSLERPQLPIPNIFPNKPLYDNQLPPIRPPSLSPQSSINMPYNSPGIAPINPDYPPSHSRRDLPGSANVGEDAPLDPVSALLRAGEIVKRNEQTKESPQRR